jgi:hypothetical protein
MAPYSKTKILKALYKAAKATAFLGQANPFLGPAFDFQSHSLPLQV